MSKISTGTVAAPTTTGDTQVSTPGVNPKAIIAFLSLATADQTFTSGAMLSLGFSDGTNHGSIMSWSRDAQAGNSSQHKLSITALFDVDDPGSTDAFVCTVTLGTGGFTISTSVAAPAGWVIHYMAIGGITSAKVGSFTSAASTGDQDITDPGIQGDFLMLLANNNAAGVATSGAFGLGVADAAGHQGTTALRSVFGSNPTQVYSYQRTDKVYARTDNAGAVNKEASFVSWLPNGFRLNWNVAAADLIPYLVLKDSGAVVTTDTQKTSTGTKSKSGGFGRPAGLFVFGWNAAASASVDATQARIALGMTDGSTVGTVWNGETDNVATSVAKSRSDTSKILAHATEPSTVDAAAVLSSFDSDGYTFNYTTADAVVRQFIPVVFPIVVTDLLVNRTVGQNKNGGVQTNLAIVNRPTSGVLAGDLLLAFIAVDRQTVLPQIIPVDSGWTQEIFEISLTAAGQTLAVFSRVATAGDPSSWDFNLKDSGSSQTMAWVTCCVSVAGLSTPIVDQKNGSEDTVGPVMTTSSITPSANNSVVFSVVAQDQSDNVGDTPTFVATSPGGLTELSDNAESTTNLGLAVYYETQTTAASTSHTITESGGTTSRGAATAILSVLPNVPLGSVGKILRPMRMI